VYANNQPDELLQSLQQHFENPINDLAVGPGRGAHISSTLSAIGNLNPSALGKTINVETENTLRVFQNYFGPYPYHQLAVTNIIGSYGQGWPGLLYLSWITFLEQYATARSRGQEPDPAYRFLPRAREFSSVVGTAGRLEELPRSVAV
jgi:hypothetical protein